MTYLCTLRQCTKMNGIVFKDPRTAVGDSRTAVYRSGRWCVLKQVYGGREPFHSYLIDSHALVKTNIPNLLIKEWVWNQPINNPLTINMLQIGKFPTPTAGTHQEHSEARRADSSPFQGGARGCAPWGQPRSGGGWDGGRRRFWIEFERRENDVKTT